MVADRVVGLQTLHWWTAYRGLDSNVSIYEWALSANMDGLDRELLPPFGPPGRKFSGGIAQGGDDTIEPFISDTGGLLPIALWGRTSL